MPDTISIFNALSVGNKGVSCAGRTGCRCCHIMLACRVSWSDAMKGTLTLLNVVHVELIPRSCYVRAGELVASSYILCASPNPFPILVVSGVARLDRDQVALLAGVSCMLRADCCYRVEGLPTIGQRAWRPCWPFLLCRPHQVCNRSCRVRKHYAPH